jgi:DNA polymerase/3'-5' exonuclease PolX
MPVQNAEIAAMFDRTAELLEIQGDNPFRARAYRRAARVIEGLPQSVVKFVSSGHELCKLPGIGKDLAGKIGDIVETGHFALLDSLKKKLPGDLADMAALPGLGPKRVKLLFDMLHIRTLDDLRRVVRSGRIREVRGFGPVIERKLAVALAKPAAEKRFRLVEAEAEALVAHLRNGGRIVVAGSYRRRRDTVGDLDVLVTAADGDAVGDRLVHYENVAEVIAHGPTRTAVVLRSGLQVDIRSVPEQSYGAALLYFTGSKAHNTQCPAGSARCERRPRASREGGRRQGRNLDRRPFGFHPGLHAIRHRPGAAGLARGRRCAQYAPAGRTEETAQALRGGTPGPQRPGQEEARVTMSRRHQSAMNRCVAGAAAIVLSVLSVSCSARAEAVKSDQVAYDVKVNEDRAAKACMLGLAIKDYAVGETVRFQLVVARTKSDDVLAGPAVFGFTIAVEDLQVAAPRESEPRALELTSAAFTSERYTAAARPRSTPFADGSWVASTLDTVDGGELIEAAASGKFQIAYTRTRPIAARIYEVTSAPPLDVLLRFTGCIDGLQVIE